MGKRGKAGLVALAVVVVGGALGAWHFLRGEDGSGRLQVYGNIELTEVELAFRVAGRIAERPLDEGDTVEAGQLVAKLDDDDLRQKVDLAAAQVAASKAALAELEAGSRPEEIAQSQASLDRAKALLRELEAGSRPDEIKAAQATLRRAEAELRLASDDFDRQKALYADGTISKRVYDAAFTTFDAARAHVDEATANLKLVQLGPRVERIDQARAVVRQNEEALALALNGPRKETIDQARAKLALDEAALAVAKTTLGYATLTSPVAGVVLSKASESGEFVSPGTPVVTVADLRKVWLRAYIPETDLGRVKIGQAVDVATDTYPGKVYEGRISFIASEAEFTPKNVQTKDERVKLVYRIKVDLDNPDLELKPGMPADALIVTQDN